MALTPMNFGQIVLLAANNGFQGGLDDRFEHGRHTVSRLISIGFRNGASCLMLEAELDVLTCWPTARSFTVEPELWR